MAFEDLMTAISRWLVATDALAAIGAGLTLARADGTGDPAVVEALHAVATAAGLHDLDALAPAQREIAIALIRMSLHHATELLDDPGRAPGWTYTDPDILQGWGRGSMTVPPGLAAAPELADVRSLLDIGTGIGLLAVAAAGVWPQATIVGIDVWPESLRLAKENVARASLDDRITIREQDVADLDDVERYDCAWFPTFFVTPSVLDAALPRVFRAVQPGGWIVLARMAPPPDPLADATSRVRTIRNGGYDFDADELSASLDAGGCVSVHVLPRRGPAPIEYVIGQRPGVRP